MARNTKKIAGKQTPFLTQAVCLAMLLLGMHLCVRGIFLEAGSIVRFAAALAVASFWFVLLLQRPLRRWERRVKQHLHVPVLKYPAADVLLLVTLCVWGVLTVYYLDHLQKDFTVLTDAVQYRQWTYLHHGAEGYDRQWAYMHQGASGFQPYDEIYQGATGTWLLLDIELLCGMFMAWVFPRRHGMFLGTLPPVLLVAAGLLVGKAPAMLSMVLMIGGILGMQLCLEEESAGGSRHFRQISAGLVRQRLFYPMFLAVVLVVLGAGAQISVATQKSVLSGEETLLKIQHSMEKKITRLGVQLVQKIQMLLDVEQPGVMTNLSPDYTGETVLTLTTQKKPKDDIYLRGFVGTQYENGTWSSVSEKKSPSVLSDLGTESCYQLLTQDYYVYQANKLSSQTGREVDEFLESPEEMGTENTMEMTISYADGNDSTYAYLPYFSKLSDDSMGTLMLDYDRGFRRTSDVDSYRVSMQQTSLGIRTLIKNIDLLQKGYIPYYGQTSGVQTLQESDSDAVENLQNTGFLGMVTIYKIGRKNPFLTQEVKANDVSDLPKLLDGESYVAVSDETLGVYFQYVMSQDLQLPENGLQRTKKLAKTLMRDDQVETMQVAAAEGTQSSANRIISDVQSYLAETTSYSMTLDIGGSASDYVENFLFEQQKGYCEHYATAGAVLLRAMGVPARYVSGYKVSAQDFEKNEDGTYTAKVPDLDAHAWTEVYSLSSGWVVADMTPGTEDAQEQQAKAQSAPQYTDSGEEDTGDDAFLQEDDETPDPEEKSTQTEEPDAADSAWATEEPTQTPDELGGENANGSDEGVSSEDAGSASPNTQEDQGLTTKQKKVLGVAAAVVAFGIVLWILRDSQKWRRRKRLKRCRTQRSYLLEMNRQLERFLKSCGYRKILAMSDAEYVRVLGQIDPKGLRDGTIAAYYQRLERARFGRDDLQESEIRESRRLIRAVKRHALASAHVWRRIYVIIVRAWNEK